MAQTDALAKLLSEKGRHQRGRVSSEDRVEAGGRPIAKA
jgi:hypothetical protein